MTTPDHASASRTRLALPTEEDRKRHEAMVQSVFAWMTRTGATQQKLVKLITRFWQTNGQADFVCDHTLLSRMLHPDAPYIATPGRRRAMQIQEAAVTVCTQRHDVHVIETAGEEEGFVWSSDQEHAFLAHRARLRQVRDRHAGSVLQMLTLMGELFVHVRGLDDTTPCNEAGETYRRRGCENLLMTLAVAVDRGSATHDLSQTLVTDEKIDRPRAERIQAEQLARIDATLACVAAPTINMNAYAAAALFFCGRRERGMYMLLDAVRRSSDETLRHDPHWETLLELAERLLAQNAPDAARWSDAARHLAAQTLARPMTDAGRQLLLEAWAAVRLPNLVKNWQAADPALVAALESHVTPPKLTMPPRALGGISRVAVATALAFTLGVLPALPGRSPATASASTNPSAFSAAIINPSPAANSSIAIRGRETKGPDNPMPGGPGAPGGPAGGEQTT